jgi:hypothetical protein
VLIKSAKLTGLDNSFTMTANRTFPVTLRPQSVSHPADTLTVTICYGARDTFFHRNTMTLQTDCFEAPVAVFGQGATPLITATDYDFGQVTIGSSNCTGNSTYGPSKITIRNMGSAEFELTNKWVIDKLSGKEFSMDPVSAARLPYTLWPAGDPGHPRKDSINLYFCYTPTDIGPDSTIITWSTDIPSPFTDQVKSWSYLKGRGVKPGLFWLEPTVVFYSDSAVIDAAITRRAHLCSSSTSVTHVDKVYTSGKDSAEFSISGNQLNLNPLEGFDLNVGDTIWIDVTFTPDLSKTGPEKYADRHAKLETIFFADHAHTIRDTIRTDLVRTVDKSLGIISAPKQYKAIKAYTYGPYMIVEMPNDDEQYSDCSLYDLLGRKVTQWSKQNISVAEYTMMLPLPKVSSGSYVLRLRSESGAQVSTLVMIEK